MNIVVKVGGAFLDKSTDNYWIDELVHLRKSGHNIVVVHGAGPHINRAYEEHNVKPVFHDGQRKTLAEHLPIVERVLSHQVNPLLVDMIKEKNTDAIGISAADGKILECSQLDPNLGQVGKVESVNIKLLEQLSEHGIVVLSPVGYGQGKKYNVNADVAAAAVASSLPNSTMIFLTGTEGLLDASGKLISKVNTKQIDELIINKTIQGGMIVKVNMIKAILEKAKRVAIINASKKKSLTSFILEASFSGTVFTRANS